MKKIFLEQEVQRLDWRRYRQIYRNHHGRNVRHDGCGNLVEYDRKNNRLHRVPHRRWIQKTSQQNY